jgi:nitroreductase
MEVKKAVKTRRSIRKYKRIAVQDQLILECLDVARWAPSANNSQPWEFIVIRNPETMKKLGDIHHGGSFMADSLVVVVFLADPRRSPSCYHGDVAVAAQSFMLAAHSIGLGTCWIGVINTEYEQPVKKLLGVPPDLVVLCAVSIGYPDERPRSSRRSVAEMLHWERYEGTTK